MLLREFLDKKGLSKTIVKRAKLGGLFVSGEAVTVRRVLKIGELVAVKLFEKEEEKITPVDIPINVVYEDEYIMVVDKPTNMPTHPSRGNSLPTLANAVVARMGSDFTFRAINRLDRDTSGLVLIAKDPFSASRLSQALKNGEFSKKYTALVKGIPKDTHGIIDAPVRREFEASMKRVVSADGKRALTEYDLLEVRGEDSVLEVTLHTGRTHQIRVHLAYIGHPLVGDFLYGVREDCGYFLRCNKLSFPHPISGKTIKIEI